MSVATAQDRLQLPESLREQLLEFRRRVWAGKTAEAGGAAAFGVVVAYLLLFALDRLVETPGWARSLLFVVTAASVATVPLALHRWVWRRRTLEQLALLLARTQPQVGDQLLGVIELSKDDTE